MAEQTTLPAKMRTRPHLDFTIEASELGWQPGYFPDELVLKITMGDNDSLIARTYLDRVSYDLTPDGELAGVRYASQSGNVNALVIND